MERKIVKSGKMLMQYIIDYLIWGIIILIGTSIISGIIVEPLESSYMLVLAILVALFIKIIGNFFVVFLTVKSVFKKYTISSTELKSFLKKLLIFYLIVFGSYVASSLLEEATLLVMILSIVINAIILLMQFLYTRYISIKDVNKNESINYTTERQESQYYNQQTINQMTDSNNQSNIENSNNQYIYQNVEQNTSNENIQNINITNKNSEMPINDMDNYQTQTILNNNINNQNYLNQTKICPQCGKELDINNNLCDICGYTYNN